MGARVRWALGMVMFMPVVNAADTVRLRNHQDYAIHLPVTLRNTDLHGAALSDGRPVQRDGTDAIFVASLPAGTEQTLSFQSAGAPSNALVVVEAAENGIALRVAGKSAGVLTWDLIVEPAKKPNQVGELLSTKDDYAAKFSALPIVFHKKDSGPVFDTWLGTGKKAGLALAFEVRVFHEGFVDTRAKITNENAPATHVSAALVCRWLHPAIASRTLCYDNRPQAFGETAVTLFHGADDRHWHLQHGVDWIQTQFADGTNVVWINPFDPVFTLATAKGFTVGSQAQFGREAQSVPDALFSVTEIARNNLRSYRERVVENALPPAGESLEITTRLAVSSSALTAAAADQLFLGTTAYRTQRAEADKVTMDFGVPAVRFGTSYFPYSTLGENFDAEKLPGMDREGFWPLAADTVNQWRIFADQIRQDLRMLKWLGFSLVRLHHLELLAPIAKPVRQEYLDFLFGELRHLRLKALVDIYASPEQLTELLGRYGDAIDGIQIENETLIFGIPRDRGPEWKQVYDTVKRVAPQVKVFWTAQNNTGMFDRLTALGVSFDQVDVHSYVDSLDALPSARGWALSAGDYATRVGKPASTTEWNYRGLTRMTPEARGKIYPQVFEQALATRSLADFYQFQFQETLCPNPVSGRGNLLRHYELVNLSRHPKAEALAFAEIITRYTADADPVRELAVSFAETELDANGQGVATVTLRNRSPHPLQLSLTAETPADLKMDFSPLKTLTLAPGETKRVPVTLSAPERKAGFYHGALRLEGADGFLRYATVEGRRASNPTLTAPDETAAEFLGHVAAVVYGEGSPVMEVETAVAIALTLESATGRIIPYYQLNNLPAELRSRNLIAVGTGQSNALINERVKNVLVLKGETADAVKTAGMNLILSYWPAAKDSGAGKVGLVRRNLPRTIDADKLP